MEFYNKVQEILNLMIAHINLNFDETEIPILIKTSQDLALRVFIKKLNSPLGDYISTRKPESLSEALNLLTNDFNVQDFSPMLIISNR